MNQDKYGASATEELDSNTNNVVETVEEINEAESISDRAKVISPGRMVLKRFFRSRLSVVGLAMIAFLFVFSFLGPPLLHAFGYKWGEIDTDFDTIKFNYSQSKLDYEVDGEKYGGYMVSISENLNKDGKMSAKHWLGTDDNTQDVFVRLMYGGRLSLLISFLVIFLQTFFGVVLGSLAGYFGKWVDQVVMRIVDVLYCIPGIPIMLIVGASVSGMVEANMISEGARIYVLMIIITFLGWTGIARLVRGQILMLREQEFMIAAEALGLSTPRKIFKHLFPNVLPQLIVSMTLGLGGVILMEATLSYLGLGVQPPSASWGTMISRAKETEILTNHMNQWVPPGLLIIIAVLGFNFIGDGLRDAFDPRARR